ncbi:MAG: Gfo/Idh/MocA family oxidoreductase, partial [Phycisphaerae bacterium]
MRTYGVGIIGYGFMGRTHTLAYKSIPFYYSPRPLDFSLRAVCRAKKELAADAAREGGFERAAESVEDLVSDPTVDIVHICTPNSQHIAALRAAIAAGKHIYCDKPVTGSLAEADELAGLLPAYKGVAQVACQYRFFPATLKARQLVEQGFLGPVTHFRASYLHSGSVDPNKAVNWKSTAAAGGGVIRDLGIHIIDLLWWLIGPFASASCTSRIWSPRRPSLDKPGTMMEVDDIVTHTRQGVQFQHIAIQNKAIEPIGESKSDFECVMEVAKKMGKYEEITQ